MIYIFDIDGTICKTTDGNYAKAIPMKRRIAKINKLYKEHKIVLFTARGSATGINWGLFTKKQIEGWGVMYHELIMGKPYGDVYVDDRAVSDKEFFK